MMSTLQNYNHAQQVLIKNISFFPSLLKFLLGLQAVPSSSFSVDFQPGALLLSRLEYFFVSGHLSLPAYQLWRDNFISLFWFELIIQPGWSLVEGRGGLQSEVGL